MQRKENKKRIIRLLLRLHHNLYVPSALVASREDLIERLTRVGLEDYAEFIESKVFIAAPATVGGIPNEIEDILFLLRLYNVGDVAFIRQVIVRPDGKSIVQRPYRFINDLNSDSVLTTQLNQDETDRWRTFGRFHILRKYVSE